MISKLIPNKDSANSCPSESSALTVETFTLDNVDHVKISIDIYSDNSCCSRYNREVTFRKDELLHAINAPT